MQIRHHDVRRRMSFWRRLLLALQHPVQWPVWVLRTVLSVFIVGALIVNRDSVVSDSEIWVASMALWALIVAETNAGIVLRSAASDPQYRTLWLLPLPADEIFKYVVRRSVLGSAWLLAEFLVLYGLVSGRWTAAFVCATLQTATAIALVMIIAGFRLTSERKLMAVLLLSVFMGVALTVGHPGIQRVTMNLLYAAHPFGWMNAVYVQGLKAWWALLGPVALWTLVPASLRRLRRLNADGILREVQSPRAASDKREKETAMPAEKDVPPRAEWTEAGFLERVLARLLTPQERVVADMLLIDRPQWSRMFYGLILYVGLFLLANSLIRFRSMEELLRAIVTNIDEDVIQAVAGCVLSAAFFYLLFLRGVMLFSWQASPESLTLRSKNNAFNPFFTFRLFPVSHWEAVKVITKVNSALVLFLLPVAAIVSQSPIFQMFGAHRDTSAIVPKGLTLFWAVTVFIASLRLNPCTEGWRYWRSLLAAIAMGFVYAASAVAFVASPNLIADTALMAILVMLTWAWVTYWGFRYCRGIGQPKAHLV